MDHYRHFALLGSHYQRRTYITASAYDRIRFEFIYEFNALLLSAVVRAYCFKCFRRGFIGHRKSFNIFEFITCFGYEFTFKSYLSSRENDLAVITVFFCHYDKKVSNGQGRIYVP